MYVYVLKKMKKKEKEQKDLLLSSLRPEA